MRTFAQFLYVVALTLWIGGLWVIGYLAAPTVFVVLSDNHALAGVVTARFFAAIGWIGIVCALYLMAFKIATGRPHGAAFRQTTFRVIAAMLVLVLVAQFYVQPMMADIKSQALPLSVMQSAFAGRFTLWHRISEALYTLVSLLGALLVYLEARPH